MMHKIINTLHIYKNKEEFFQHALIALWDASRRFDPEKGNFTSYAYSYIKGRLLTELKRSIHEEETTVCPTEEFWELIEEPPKSELDWDLLEHMQSLTANQRKWLNYTVHFDLSIREIAAQENVSVSAVKNWRAGAREKLKGEMSAK